jgi:sugar phosphate isomerase/epimerase
VKFALSVRVAESAKRKDVADVPIEELAPMAAAAGFAAISMRASVAGVTTPAARIAEVRSLLSAQGLGVSMVTGDVALAANTPDATDALKDIEPYLDLADAFGAKLVRVMMHDAADIPRAQKAADRAAQRGVSLAHMTHWGTLIETSEDALAIVAEVDRPNFRVVLEPANMLASGEAWTPVVVAALAPHLENVFFQNIVLDPGSPVTFRSRRQGPVGVRYVPLEDISGLDGAALIRALADVGYDGWFTMHQPLRPGQTTPEAIAEAAEFLRRTMS